MRTKERTKKDYKSHRKWVEKNREKFLAYHREYSARPEVQARRRELYRKRIDHFKKRDKEHYYLTEERHRELHASKKYGISVEEYRLLYERKVCDICRRKEIAIGRNGKVKRLAIDHDHKTKKVRGLLCQRCNQGIGLFEENIERLDKIKEYLNAKTTTT